MLDLVDRLTIVLVIAALFVAPSAFGFPAISRVVGLRHIRRMFGALHWRFVMALGMRKRNRDRSIL